MNHRRYCPKLLSIALTRFAKGIHRSKTVCIAFVLRYRILLLTSLYSAAVAFQFTQIGQDPKCDMSFRDLRDHPKLGGLVDFTPGMKTLHVTGIPTIALLTHGDNTGSVMLEGIDPGKKWNLVVISLQPRNTFA